MQNSLVSFLKLMSFGFIIYYFMSKYLKTERKITKQGVLTSKIPSIRMIFTCSKSIIEIPEQ